MHLARSRSLALLGKSTSRSKNGVLPTKELWKGIHFTQDVQASESKEEHLHRVYNRENTPFVHNSKAMAPRFGVVKDKFVAKYEPLLRESERMEKIEALAKQSRDLTIQQRQEEEERK